MRPRKQTIRESFEELDELRRFYNGTIEEVKLMFLRMLKEEPGRPIAETTRRIGISERRGRYWWETYCQNGLRGLLERRVWRRDELEKNVPRMQVPRVQKGRPRANGATALQHAIDYPAFINAVASIADVENPHEWGLQLRNLLIEHIPEVDHAVVSVRVSVDLDEGTEREERIVVRRYKGNSGEIKESIESESRVSNYETIIAKGQEQQFPFERYHFPPAGFDFFLRKGLREQQTLSDESDPSACLGSILLFRSRGKTPFSPETLDLIERLRPFITYVLTSFIARTQREMPGLEFYSEAIARIAGEANLSNREQIILNLLLIGYSEKKIADSLNISTKTVESHIYSLYRKTGVTKVNELFARYQTPVGYSRNKVSSE